MRPLQFQEFRFRFAVLTVSALLATAPLAASAATCPGAVLFAPTAPDATLDAGWTGIAQDEPIFGTTLHLTIGCVAGSPPCGSCPITGVAPNPDGHRLRCRNDTSIECTVASEVADCGGADTCRYYLSPPQPIGAGGLPFCIFTELDGAVSGSVDVESGAFAPVVPIKATIYNGTFLPPYPGPNQGCPRCVGDPIADDSLRGGTCSDGARSGLACDANGTSPYSDFGSVSFDCPPSGAGIGEFVNTLPFSTTPHSVTLTAASPPCTGGPPGSVCFCHTCNNAGADPCFGNADCPPSGGNPGICGGKRCLSGSNDGAPCTLSSECPSGMCSRPGEAPRPSDCLDDTILPFNCNPDIDGEGVCTAGPIDTYCTNHPNRGCLDDSYCDGVPGSCGSKPRPCFLDNGVIGGSVSVDGAATAPVAGVAAPTDLGAFTCLAPIANVFVNVWGLPGLARIHQSGQLAFGDAIPTPTLSVTPTPTPTLTPLPGLCPPAPDTCRTPTVVGKATIQLIDRSPDDKDQLAWKWLKGAATVVGDFGDPVGSDDYALCIYDASGLRSVLRIPAGGTCGTKPCWQAKMTGFVYKNKSAAPHGITQLTLKAGIDGKAQAQAKGKGTLLPMPSLPSLSGTLQIELRNETSGLCFGASFVPPFDKATAEQVKDRAD